MGSAETFEQFVERTLTGVEQTVEASLQRELADEPADTSRVVYSLRIQYLHALTGERRTSLTGTFYTEEAANRVRDKLMGGRSDLLFPILLRAYPRSCPLHWSPVGIRMVRLAEIPF
jgi:hypothetical protein